MNRMFTYLQITSFEKSGCLADGIPTLKCFEVVFQNILMLAVVVVMLILFIMIVVGAFQFLFARGDAGKAASAKKTITYAFVGLILFMSSYLIINIIQYLFIGDPADGAPSLLKFEIPDFKPGDIEKAP